MFLSTQRVRYLGSLLIMALVAFASFPKSSLADGCCAGVIHGIPTQVHTLLRLGSSDPSVRKNAERNLLSAGVAAWDRVYLGCRSDDVEIATACQRILGQIPFQLELAKYVPRLVDYPNVNRAHRERIIIHLGESTQQESQIALALLTRFELDEHLAKLAALELITGTYRPISNLHDWVGTSSRTGSRWLRIHALTAINFQDFVKAWEPEADAITTSEWCQRHPQAACRFLRWYIEQLLIRGEDTLAGQRIQHVLQHVTGQTTDLIETLDWLLMYRQLDACDQLLERFADISKKEIRLIYRRAELTRLRGRLAEARELVASATASEVCPDHLLRLQSAMHLQMAGLGYWTSEILTHLADDQTTPSSVRVQACMLLAEWHYQHGHFKIADESLQKAIAPSDESPDDPKIALLPVNLEVRRHLFQHLQARLQNDWKLAQFHLLEGLEKSPSDNDLLIAMVRFSDPDMSIDEFEHWQATSIEMVELALQGRAEHIQRLRVAYDRDARQTHIRLDELLAELNSYAWLASQTGVELERAERFAREANELVPTDGQVLDTLAACLFARAKLTEAVACQNQALRQAPWSPQIRLGLDRYRQAIMLAEIRGLVR